ncbi:hypothetical protein JNJ66_03635 [Candidatus Saccharibacteria bacterium]|nr:hypothetical protein [Candidatus Saccharibacteria bacterium]
MAAASTTPPPAARRTTVLDPGYNTAAPLTMHIDLNSCFATIEQQANRRTRGRPVAVAAYMNRNGMILAASYEAKACGIVLGTRVSEALKLCPGIYIVEPDPPKYREAHRRFREVLETYTSDVTPKSIDEFVVNFEGSPAIQRGSTMEEIGYAIKQDIYAHVGEAVRCNVGIGPNRFLAKLAAGLHKPDGLDRIDAGNLEQTLGTVSLMDLPGINRRFSARLRVAGIGNPVDFLHAPRSLLRGQVFHGIVGHYWWLRLRGWEIDDEPTKRSTIGHQYALPRQERDPLSIQAVLAKLCEKAGRRLRNKGLVARGIHLSVRTIEYEYWGQSMSLDIQLYSTADIFKYARRLLSMAPDCEYTLIAIGVHDFAPSNPEQLSFFDGERHISRGRDIAEAMDAINDRYGEFIVRTAAMMGAEGSARDAIAFGNLEDMEPTAFIEPQEVIYE